MIGNNLRKIIQRLLLMYCILKKKKCFKNAYVSKHNSNYEKQVILLMILNGEVWHYLATTKSSALLRGITSKNNGNFYCLYCLHSFRTKPKLKSFKKLCEIKYFCDALKPFEDTRILEFNQYQKCDEAPVIYLCRS